ncbi:MAG: PIN domain-containing protein [Parvularculaceae bacterium]
MIYVFDTNIFSHIFRSYYAKTFKTFWDSFDKLVDNREITSTREVKRELADREAFQHQETWLESHKYLFPRPTGDEAAFVATIFQVEHFQQVIELKKMHKGGKNADPFVIARAAILKGTVVTNEKPKKNGAKVPTICAHFKIPCIPLGDFMDEQGWQF